MATQLQSSSVVGAGSTCSRRLDGWGPCRRSRTGREVHGGDPCLSLRVCLLCPRLCRGSRCRRRATTEAPYARRVPHPVDRMTHAEAAELLGVHPGSVARWVVEGKLRPVSPYAKAGLLRADVEQLSLERWHEGAPWWLTAAQVAERLGVTRPRVYQLSDAGRLPYERTPDGRRLYRPGQVEVIARAAAPALPSSPPPCTGMGRTEQAMTAATPVLDELAQHVSGLAAELSIFLERSDPPWTGTPATPSCRMTTPTQESGATIPSRKCCCCRSSCCSTPRTTCTASRGCCGRQRPG